MVTFAGVTFATTKHEKVKAPTARKILLSGKVRVWRDYHYTDDYAFDAGQECGAEVSPDSLVKECERARATCRRIRYSADRDEISFCVHSNLSYTIRESADPWLRVVEAMSPEDRAKLTAKLYGGVFARHGVSVKPYKLAAELRKRDAVKRAA